MEYYYIEYNGILFYCWLWNGLPPSPLPMNTLILFNITLKLMLMNYWSFVPAVPKIYPYCLLGEVLIFVSTSDKHPATYTNGQQTGINHVKKQGKYEKHLVNTKNSLG